MPFVRMRDLGGYHNTTCLDTTRDAVSPATIETMRLKIFEPGCILFPRSGSVALNHRAILGVRACIVSHIGILRQFHKDIDVRWLYWFLVRYDMSVIAKQTTGLDLVGFSDIKKISIPIAPLPEQRRIVGEIEKQFSRLEEGVEALKRVQANLRRYRAAVLKAACEGRLVPTEAERQRSKGRGTRGGGKYETGEELLARILAERRKNWQGRGKYKEPAAPDTSKLGKLPEGWAWATVEQLADIGSGNTPAKISDHLLPTGPIPWFKVGDMNRQGNEQVMSTAESYMSLKSAEALGLRIFPAGSIVFPKRGGAIATNKKRQLEAPSTTDLNVMALMPHREINGYFKKWFASIDLASLSDGSNVPQVNNKDIQPLPVPLPPLAEQSRIVAEVERRLSVVEEMEATVEANLQRATRLRQSILQKAFTGGFEDEIATQHE